MLTIKSYNEILSDQIRKLMAVTGLNDTSKGSVLMTLLEAAAQEDFAQYGQLIELLNNFSLDTTSGADLDKRAFEVGISRLYSTSASGYVNISDSSITKVYSALYIGANSPIIGDTIIKVTDASDFVFPGSIYIGRGTANFEGPIVMSGAPTDNTSYWTITLAAPLSKNHNLNETVILKQGGARPIATGTIVQVPANNISSEVNFTVVSTQTMADGEDTVENILVSASVPGTTGNIPISSITQFSNLPFNGATVTNTTAFSNARDLETDQELRDRIKSTIQSLARGTGTAILSGIVGVSDDDENKRVVSASILEPTLVTDTAKVYIDDGTGFEPSFAGQGFDDIIIDAAGTEQFLQLGQYPVVKAQVETTSEQPFDVGASDTLIVRVNDEEETITFLSTDFRTTGAALAVEVAQAINAKSTLIEARTSEGQKKVVIFAKTINNESIQVVGGTANLVLDFPTDIVYTIKLYKNDVLLSKDGITASTESASYSSWTAITSPATLTVQVDNKPAQYLSLTNSTLSVSLDGTNWQTLSSPITFVDLGVVMGSASVAQWVIVLDQMINGADVTVNGDKIKITSNMENSPASQVQIITGGNLVTSQGWDLISHVGKDSDFSLNRFNGQIELVSPLVAGDYVSAGSPNTRGQLISSVALGGTFNLSLSPLATGRIPELYFIVDGTMTSRILTHSTTNKIAVTNTGGSTYRYTASVGTTAVFTALQVGDYVVIANLSAGWLVNPTNTGIFKVTDVDGGFTWFEVTNPLGIPEAAVLIPDTADIQAFSSDTPPQRVIFTPAAATTVSSVVTQINAQLVGASAEVVNDDFNRLRTNTFNSSGSIQIAAIIGNAINIGFPTSLSTSITSHIASVQSYDESGFPIIGAYGALTSNDTTLPYTTVIDTSRAFLTDSMTKPGQWLHYLSGNNKSIKGIISELNGANQVTLRSNSTSLVSENFLNTADVDDLYFQSYPFDFEGTDNLVAVLDNDETNKTYNIPLFRHGRISTIAVPTAFDGIDDDAGTSPSFGGSLWTGYDFADYKVWFKAHNVIDPTNNKNAIIYRAKKYGPTGELIRLIYGYNTQEDMPLSASLVSTDTDTTVSVLLGTDLALATTQDLSTEFNITIPVAGSIKYTWSGVGTNPNFAPVTVGDIVTFNSTNFTAANNGTFKISATNNTTYITVIGTGFVEAGKTLGSVNAMSIFPLLGDTGLTVRNIINNTAAINSMIEAVLTTVDPAATSNDGSGLIEYSTLDDPAITKSATPSGGQADLSGYVTLNDGENWIKVFTSASPSFTLKTALAFINVVGGAGDIYNLATTPVYGTASLGEPFTLIPTTGKNLVDHMNKTAITSLSLNADIVRSNKGGSIQISSMLMGSQGGVSISGGLGNGSSMSLGSNAIIYGSTLRAAVSTASITGFHRGQLVKSTNTYTTNKTNTFNAATTATISTSGSLYRVKLNKRSLSLAGGTTITVAAVSGNIWKYTIAVAGSFSAVSVGDELQTTGSGLNIGNMGSFPIIGVDGAGTWVNVINPTGVGEGPIVVGTTISVSVPFFTYWPQSSDGTTEISVEKLSQSVSRYRWTTVGTAPVFDTNGVRADHMVVIGSPFLQSNRGTFRIVDVNDTYFSVVNDSAIEETITINATAFEFKTADSAEPGDILNIGTSSSASWFNVANQGQWEISTVGRDGSYYHYVDVINTNGYVQGPITLGANYSLFYVLEGSPFETYRRIENLAIDPSNVLNHFLYISPNTFPSRFTTSCGTILSTVNKLYFPTNPVKGVDGYRYWTGLLRRVQRTIDGYDADPITYPGIKAAGVQIEVTPPLLKRISIGVDVRTISGTSILILMSSIKSAILSYVTSLGVGSDVILSQVVKKVQEVPGVLSVIMTDPDPTLAVNRERIVIQDNEKAIMFEEDISVG